MGPVFNHKLGAIAARNGIINSSFGVSFFQCSDLFFFRFTVLKDLRMQLNDSFNCCGSVCGGPSFSDMQVSASRLPPLAIARVGTMLRPFEDALPMVQQLRHENHEKPPSPCPRFPSVLIYWSRSRHGRDVLPRHARRGLGPAAPPCGGTCGRHQVGVADMDKAGRIPWDAHGQDPPHIKTKIKYNKKKATCWGV